MTRASRRTFVVALVTLATGACRSRDATPTEDRQGLARVPPADARRYAAVRDFAEWRNPYIVVKPAGADVCISGKCDLVPVSALGAKLESLPLSAWPYGKVVALQDVSIISGGEEKALDKNHVDVDKTLRGLGIAIVPWPSA
jgi:hypothetical protein